jgi:hypothetical protein
MNREDIIRTAKEAGFVRVGFTWVCDPDEIEAFATLVASAEREACANTAGLALLGADKALSDRVLKAIRARGQA